MKKILLLNILFLISSMAYGYTMYSTSSYLHSRNTSVAYTQTYNTYNNTGAYKTPKIGYSTAGYEKTGYYTGTYTPESGNNNSSGKPGQPRRSPGVPTVNGYDSINNNGPSFGGGTKGTWFNPYKDERYNTGFWEWLTSWGESDYDEYTYTHDPDRFWNDIDWSNETNQNNIYLQNLWIHDHSGEKPHPWDPYMTPIGEPIIPTALLLLSYIGYKTLKRKRK